MKCLNQYCNADEIEEDDNFCYQCGRLTTRGYLFLKKSENSKILETGLGKRKDYHFSFFITLAIFSVLLFLGISVIRGTDFYKPIYFMKRQIDHYIYGYHTAMIKTDQTYQKKSINSLEDAVSFIKNDMDNQNFKCTYALDTLYLETEMEESYSIPSVSLCDISYEEAEKIKNVVDKMYMLFPNISGALTNISVTNAKTKSEYIAYFQPMFQFVNSNEDIQKYHKVNKTQILLNSYYFLNDDVLKEPIENIVGENWYVKDAAFESTIAHELGHYIMFTIFLRENGLENIIYITEENVEKITQVLEEYDTKEFSREVLTEALENYNEKYSTNLDLPTFASTISKYASSTKDGVLLTDETIAEAIHDYYLHQEECEKSSLEIVNVIKARLDG